MIGPAALSAIIFTRAPAEIALEEAPLTGSEGLPLGGYSERKGVLGRPGPRPLRARLLLVQQGGRRVVIGCLEQLTIPESLVEAVKADIPSDVGLFLAATHTHCAPDSQMLNSRMTFRIPGVEPFRRRELDRVSGIVAGAIRRLLVKKREVVRTAEADAWRADSNHGRRKGAVPDPKALVIRVNGRDLLGVYSAHPTLFEPGETEYAGDWPGAWMDRGLWMAFPGAIGDVSPSAKGRTGWEKSRALVENLVQTQVNMGKTSLEPSLLFGFSQPTIALPPPVPHPDFARDNKVPDALARLAVSRFAPPSASLTLLNFGSLLLVGVPGEPSSGAARRLRITAQYGGFGSTVVMSHVNGWAGYMLEPDDYAQGGYEATLQFYGPGLTARLSEALARGLEGQPRMRPKKGASGEQAQGRTSRG